MHIDSNRRRELERIAHRVRRHILKSVYEGQGGHLGGALSAVELLTALYFHTLRIDPRKPDWPDRDRFVLSKGHAAVGLYAVLAERGYFATDELATFDAIDSRMQAHPDMKLTPGVDASTGSLGQGLSMGIGMALGARLKKKDFFTYVMLGDGELQEGQVWEAAFIGSRYGMDNLVAVIDNNKVQLYGWQYPSPRLPMEDPAAKFKAFGWKTLDIDGHDFEGVIEGFEWAKSKQDGRPTAIIADTVKGKGVSFMEHQYEWHARVPTEAEYEQALAELSQGPNQGAGRGEGKG